MKASTQGYFSVHVPSTSHALLFAFSAVFLCFTITSSHIMAVTVVVGKQDLLAETPPVLSGDGGSINHLFLHTNVVMPSDGTLSTLTVLNDDEPLPGGNGDLADEFPEEFNFFVLRSTAQDEYEVIHRIQFFDDLTEVAVTGTTDYALPNWPVMLGDVVAHWWELQNSGAIPFSHAPEGDTNTIWDGTEDAAGHTASSGPQSGDLEVGDTFTFVKNGGGRDYWFNLTGDFDTDVGPSTFEWKTSELGLWSEKSNWSTPFLSPPDKNDTAVFGGIVSKPTTVVVNAAVTVNGIQFDNESTFAIAGVGSVNLTEGTDSVVPMIKVLQGNHQFQVQVNLNNDTTVDVAQGTSLTLNNVLDLGGNPLQKIGEGTLAINNVLNSGGGTIECLVGICSGSGTIGGNLVNNGTVAPGNSPGILTVDGDYTQGSSGTLEIEIAGLVPGKDHDKLVVTGAANLDGTLDVTLLNGFSPNSGDTFDILDFASVSGNFNTLNLPASFNWNVSTGALTFGAAIGGFADYDNDGTWNLGDLNLVLFNWQQNEGSLPAEWVNQRPTAVGLDSLNQVLFNWQQASSLAIVPEPTSEFLLLMGLLAVGSQQRGHAAESVGFQ